MTASGEEMERLIREEMDTLPGILDISCHTILSRIKDIKGLRPVGTQEAAEGILFQELTEGAFNAAYLGENERKGLYSEGGAQEGNPHYVL